MSKIYEAMNKQGSIKKANCLDLKNRKQTGDLEKKIFNLNQKNKHQIFHFTCSKGKEGVSTVIINLINYLKLQKSSRKLLLVDANMHNPAMHSFLNVPNGPGLAAALNDNTDNEEQSIVITTEKTDLIPCGTEFSKHADTISQEKFSSLLERYRHIYDYIFVDSTSLFRSTDSLSIGMACDATFMIIQAVTVSKPVARKAKSMLTDNECLIGGVILNKVPQVIPDWIYKIM